MKRKFITTTALAGMAVFALSCSDTPTVREGMAPQPSATHPANGTAGCMGDDALAAGFIGGMANAYDLNCTANDVDIAQTRVTAYAIGTGAYQPLAAGDTIQCRPGDVLHLITFADLQNNAQERYDIGVWIGQQDSTQALHGSCENFNLVNGVTGVANIDGDQCGDMQAGGLTAVALDTLTVTCQNNPSGSVQLPSCIGWQNSIGKTDLSDPTNRVCPITKAPNVPTGFRWGTTPETKAKCNCGMMNLPVLVRGVLRIAKVTVPTPDPTNTSFGFTTTGTDYGTPFSLKNGETNVSPALKPGTYTATEAVPAGFTLTARSCVLTGTTTPKTFSNITNGVSVNLGSGEDITCTFTNTQKSTLIIRKITQGGTGAFNFTSTGGLPSPADGSGNFTLTTTVAGTAVADTFANLTPGTAYGVSETVPTSWVLGSRVCSETVAGAGGSTFPASGTTQPATITLAAGATVTCTYTDAAKPTLIIQKVSQGGTGTFNFTSTGGLPSPAVSGAFALTTVAVNTAVADTFKNLTPGTAYGVSETVPTNFVLGSRVCVETVAGVGGSSFPASGTTQPATITLVAGATVTCTYTNALKPTLIIRKISQGGTGTFNFTSTGGLPSPAVSGAFALTTVAVNTAVADTFPNLTPGTAYGVSETVPSSYVLTSRVCSETVAGVGGSTFPASGTTQPATITLVAGATVTCTYTDVIKPTLIIAKTTVGHNGGTFNFTSTGGLPSPAVSGAFSLVVPSAGAVVADTFANLTPGTFGVSETVPAGWALSSRTCTELVAGVGGSTFPASGTTQPASITLVAGATVRCLYTDTELARLITTKTIINGTPADTFDFTRNPGPGTTSFSLGNGGSNNSGKILPAGTYRVCELSAMVSNTASATVTNGSGLNPVAATLINPDAPSDNGTRCVDVVLAAGDSVIDAWTNERPGGNARTIGYWKNWSSCAQSNGKQYLKALARDEWDKTLDGNLPQTVGLLTLAGAAAADQPAAGCNDAVDILNKSTISGTKAASNAAFNMAAQLLAAMLNRHAGAYNGCNIDQLITDAQALLVAVGFNGSTLPSLTSTQTTQARTFADLLDHYNNNTCIMYTP